MSVTTNVLCYGDSLTWGWVPIKETAPTSRYAHEQRWTGVLAAALGNEYVVITEGLSGRTTDIDDPYDARLNGSAYLPAALASHLPIDLVIIMLGTNDTKACFNRTPHDIANGIGRLAGQVASSAGGVGTAYPAPRLLIVAPPPLGNITDPWLSAMFEGGQERSAQLAPSYAALAAFLKVDFLDAGQHISTDGADGIHLSASMNARLGNVIASKVSDIFRNQPE